MLAPKSELNGIVADIVRFSRGTMRKVRLNARIEWETTSELDHCAGVVREGESNTILNIVLPTTQEQAVGMLARICGLHVE